MNKDSKIYVAGHTGLVGSAILKRLIEGGYNNILTKDFSELDLRVQSEVKVFFQKHKPEYVILAAAKVGGIMANNTYRAQFLYENLMIENNIIIRVISMGLKNCCFWEVHVFIREIARNP